MEKSDLPDVQWEFVTDGLPGSIPEGTFWGTLLPSTPLSKPHNEERKVRNVIDLLVHESDKKVLLTD